MNNFSNLTERLNKINFSNSQKYYLVTSEKDNQTRKDLINISPSKCFLYKGKNPWKIISTEQLPTVISEDMIKTYNAIMFAQPGNDTWAWNFLEFLVINDYGYKIAPGEYLIKGNKFDEIKNSKTVKKLVISGIKLSNKTDLSNLIGKSILY